MSAIIGRYVREGDMRSGSELCLECANAFDRRSSSRARRDVTLLWILRDAHLHDAGRSRVLDTGGVEGPARPVPLPAIAGRFDALGLIYHILSRPRDRSPRDGPQSGAGGEDAARRAARQPKRRRPQSGRSPENK